MAMTPNVSFANPIAPEPARCAAPLLCLAAGLVLGTLLGALPMKITAMAMAGAVGGILALGFPYAGSCLFVCALVAVTEPDAGYEQRVWPIRDAGDIPGLPSALWSFFLLLFGGAMFRLYFVRQGCSRIPLYYMGVFAGILLLATAVGLRKGWPTAGMHAESLRFLYPILFFYLVLNVFDSRERIRRALWLMFGVAAFTALVLAGYYLAGKGVQFELHSAAQGSRIVTDDSAILMTFTAMLLLALAHIMSGQANRVQTLGLALGCIPLAFALLFSFRRAEWLGAAGGVLMLVLIGTRAERMRLLRFCLPLVPALLLVIAILGSLAGTASLTGNLTRRFQTLLDGRHSSNRYHLYESLQTLRDIGRQPFTGLGLASRHGPLPEYPHSEVPLNVVHNAWLYIWMKLGLLGLLATIWVSVRYLRRVAIGLRCKANPLERPLLQALAALVPIWFMQSVSGPMPWYPRVTMQVVLYAAMALNLVYLSRTTARWPAASACAPRQ